MHTKLKLTPVATVAALVLSGCMSESPCDAPLPGSRVAAAGQMTDCLSTMSATPVAMMPTSGGATYNGYVTGTFTPSAGTSDSLIGDATLTADFTPGAANAVSGTLSNFAAGNDPTLSGTLTVGTSGLIVGNAFNATINGTLSGYGPDSLVFATNGAGGFLGDNAQGVTVATTGSVTVGAYTGTAGLAIVARK